MLKSRLAIWLAAVLTYLFNSAWIDISLAHDGNVCLMIGVYQDNMCSSDNKKSWLCMMPVIFKGFKGSPKASAREGHVSQHGHKPSGQLEKRS